MLEINKIHQGDCLEVMKDIPDKSVDMILCDLPYGTTACSWDEIIPFNKLWQQYKRIIKDNGAIVLFGSEPFSSMLRLSNLENYKYDLIWDKKLPVGHLIAKKRPLQRTESISIFSEGTMTNGSKRNMPYYPQMEKREKKRKFINDIKRTSSELVNKHKFRDDYKRDDYVYRYPTNILVFTNADRRKIHPTQKPVALFEYLIKTYSNEEDLILDNCAGSGTTGVACKNLKRNFILIEKEEKYINIIKNRLSQTTQIQPIMLNNNKKEKNNGKK